MGIIALGASILDALIFGYKTSEEDGTPLPVRTILNFIGFNVADNPTNKSTDVTCPGVLGAGLPFVIDGASAPIAAGQWFTTAPGATTVTLATSASLALMPGVHDAPGGQALVTDMTVLAADVAIATGRAWGLVRDALRAQDGWDLDEPWASARPASAEPAGEA